MRESVAFGSFSKTAFVGGHNTTSLHKELKSFYGVLELCPFEGHLTDTTLPSPSNASECKGVT